jgi:hypothetical protein
MSANDRQVGGEHYKKGGEEHWDRAWRLKYDPFQYIITKWVERWKDKGGLQDLQKAQHALEKYIEVNTPATFATELTGGVDTFSVELGDVVPTGWKGFVFEGANAEGYLFTCRTCRAKFYALPDDNPHTYHSCPPDGEPGSGYVNQD